MVLAAYGIAGESKISGAVGDELDDDRLAGLYSIVYENPIAFHAEAMDNIAACELKNDGIPFFDGDDGWRFGAMSDLIDQALPCGNRTDAPTFIGRAAQDEKLAVGRHKGLRSIMIILLNGQRDADDHYNNRKKEEAISGYLLHGRKFVGFEKKY